MFLPNPYIYIYILRLQTEIPERPSGQRTEAPPQSNRGPWNWNQGFFGPDILNAGSRGGVQFRMSAGFGLFPLGAHIAFGDQIGNPQIGHRMYKD